MINKDARIETERAILGGVIFENKYQVAAKFLEPKNFFLKEHELVFECIKQLYPLKPIDLISVAQALIQKYPDKCPAKSWAVYLSDMTHEISSTANLEYHSLLVLEWDIIDRYIELLTEQLAGLESDVFKSAALEVLEMVKDPSPVLDNAKLDSLSLVRQGYAYLASIKYPEAELAELQRLSEQIDIRILKAKRMVFFDNVVNQLIRFCEISSDNERKEGIRRLSNLILALGFSTQLPPDYIAKIKSLEQQLA